MYLYEDQSLPFEARAADLVSQLTLEEKIAQLASSAPAIERLGIRSWNWWNEASHGVIAVFQAFKEATSFPACLAMSQSWNPELIEQISTAISDEMRALWNMNGKELDYWCPTVNMGRDPRWGRNDESFGEDPFLAGKLAAAYVRGIQGYDGKYLKAISTPKHFAVNNSEYNRNTGTSNVDEATLREYYLDVFERCVREGGAYSIMTSYNRINGIPASAHVQLLKSILREEWGFDGYTVSDAGAVADVGPNQGLMWDQVRGHFYAKSMEEASAMSLLAGTDICTGREHDCYLMDAIKQGFVSEKTLDRALIRSFTARFRLGEFDDPGKVPFHSIGQESICSDKNTELAEKIARESMTLLKNESNILPIDSKKVKKIAVIGPNAIYRQMGSYSIGSHPRSAADTRVSIPPLAGIKAKADELGIQVTYAKGWHITDRPMFDLPGSEILLREARESGKPLKEYLEERMPEETRRRHAEQAAMMEAHKDDPIPERRHPVIDPDIGRDEQELFSEALKVAAGADAVIVIAGTDPSVTSEGRDRATLALPYDQDGKIREILKVNPHTVVVCVSVGPTIGEFIREVPGLVYAVYAGQSQGKAIADVLFGAYNPSGRTTQTWYAKDEDMPHISEYGIRIHDTMTQMGRTYLYYLGHPVFPFGYGLSYTKFEYSHFSFSKTSLDANDTLIVSADITNTGDMAGYEVVQLYTRKIKCYDNKPYKQLKGFRKVWLNPGETKAVSIELPLSEMRFWNYGANHYIVESGTYAVWFGRDCDEGSVITGGEIDIHGEWNAPLSAVALFSDRSILKPGEDTELEVAATLMNAVHLDVKTQPVVITSSDPSVALVTSGQVRAISFGVAVITAELTRDSVTKRAALPIKVI